MHCDEQRGRHLPERFVHRRAERLGPPEVIEVGAPEGARGKEVQLAPKQLGGAAVPIFRTVRCLPGDSPVVDELTRTMAPPDLAFEPTALEAERAGSRVQTPVLTAPRPRRLPFADESQPRAPGKEVVQDSAALVARSTGLQ